MPDDPPDILALLERGSKGSEADLERARERLARPSGAGRSPAPASRPAGATDTERAVLEALAQKMPFGRYAGSRLIDLPEGYLVWWSQQGFPSGRLGEQLALALEVKHNGLAPLFRPLLGEG